MKKRKPKIKIVTGVINSSSCPAPLIVLNVSNCLATEDIISKLCYDMLFCEPSKCKYVMHKS